MWISRKTSNHMVPLSHVKGKLKRGLIQQVDEELAESSNGTHWDDTEAEIVWETDTLQGYHKTLDENGTLVNDPNFILKSIPPNV